MHILKIHVFLLERASIFCPGCMCEEYFYYYQLIYKNYPNEVLTNLSKDRFISIERDARSVFGLLKIIRIS
jgi:hypothetical protein